MWQLGSSSSVWDLPSRLASETCVVLTELERCWVSGQCWRALVYPKKKNKNKMCLFTAEQVQVHFHVLACDWSGDSEASADSFIRPEFIFSATTVRALPGPGSSGTLRKWWKRSSIRPRKEMQICWSICEYQEEITLFVCVHPSVHLQFQTLNKVPCHKTNG